MDKRLKHAWIFLAGTIVLTWILYFTIVMLGLSPYSGLGLVLLLIGGSIPSSLGFVMAMVTYPKAQRLDYLRRCYDVRRIRPLSWALIVFLFPLVVGISIAVNSALGGALPEMVKLHDIAANPVVFFPVIVLSFFSGPFSEELGWRGFALSPLLERYGFTRSSLILGVIWGVWHLPLYFMPETWHAKMGFQLAGFWSFILMNIGLTMIMSLVFINSRRSILAAMLMHLAANFSTQLIAAPTGPGYEPRIELIRSLLMIGIGVAICARMVRTGRDAAANYVQTGGATSASRP